MNCREAEKHLFAADDGALADGQRAALASHLDGCAACRHIRNELSGFVATWRTETEQTRVPDAGIEWRKLQRQLSASSDQRRTRVSWFALPSAALAAAAVAIGVYFGVNHAPVATNQPAAPTVAMTTPSEATIAPTPPSVAPSISQSSTVVFVDDKSGWTFVWDDDSGRHI